MKYFLNLVLTLLFNRKKELLRKEMLFILFLSFILFSTPFLHSQTIDSLITQNESLVYVGSEIDYPPYCMIDAQGNPEGFSVDLFKAVAKEMNLNIKFKTGIWSKLKDDLKEGTIDALPLVGRTPEREEIFDFTFPYLTMHGCILIRDDVTNISTLEDLIGKKVAVLKGDNSEEFVNRIKLNATIFPTNSYDDAIKDLSENKYDAVIIQKMVALHILKELQITNLKIVVNPLYEFKQKFCFAVTEDNSELLSKLNEGLAIVGNNGRFDELYKKWFLAYETEKFKKLTIVVGGDDSYPPYEFIDEQGRPAGYNIDLTKAIAKEIGLIVDIKLGPWSQVKSDLDNGKVDIVQGMFYSDERTKTYSFSQAHTSIGHVMVSRKGFDNSVDISQLIDSSIVVQRSDILHEYLIDNGFRNIITVTSQEKALQLVSEGRYNFAFVNRLPAFYWIKKNEWDNLVINDQSILSSEYCYTTLKENEKLLEMFTEGLKSIKETGEYRIITSKWFGVYDEEVYDYKNILRYSIYLLLLLAILIIVIFIWSNTLRRQVRKRTNALNIEIDNGVNKENLLLLTNEQLAKAKEEAEESEAKFKKLSNLTIEGIVLHKKGIAIDINLSFSKIFGYTPEEIIGKNIVKLLIKEEYHPVIAQMIIKDHVIPYELVGLRKDGTELPLEIEGHAIELDGKAIRVTAVRDISERKEFQKELQKQNKELINAKEKAEEADRLKSAFLSNMSHEIRTPMNGILGFINLLNEPDLSKDEIEEYTAVINRGGERLLITINDIIDISRIESGEMVVSKEETSINRMMDELYSFFLPEVKLKGLSLFLKPANEQLAMFTDSHKLHGILTNLIKNAIKFTEKGSITLGYVLKKNTMHNEQGESTEVEFFVEDTGSGIPKDRMQAIFNRFEQADIEDVRSFQGSGLGLAISSAYIKMLGGDIFVESEYGKGSKFTFTIPYIEN